MILIMGTETSFKTKIMNNNSVIEFMEILSINNDRHNNTN